MVIAVRVGPASVTMADLLPDWPLLWAFVAASLALALAPGPAVLYIVSRSLGQGARFGLASVAGVALGNVGCALVAALGMSALLAASSSAFTTVKLAGAAYLVFLGGRMLLARSAAGSPAAAPSVPIGRAFVDGVLVALLNPKTALFFAAYLPQFVQLGAKLPVFAQTMALGTLFGMIAALTDCAYALAAGVASRGLERQPGRRAWSGRWAGASLIALGIYAAWSGPKAAGR